MSKRVFKVVSSLVFSAIIILALGGYFVAKNFDLNKYKYYAEDTVKKYTGRVLKIKGDAKVAISLIPTVVVNDVELSNPEWAQNPQMIKLKQAEVKISLLPLLKKKIVVDKVILQSPEVFLEKSVNGESSWDFAKNTPLKTNEVVKKLPKEINQNAAVASAGAVAFAGFVAKNVQIQNGSVSYYDAKSEKTEKVDIKNITLKVPAIDADINASWDMVYNSQGIKGEATFGSVQQLLNGGKSFPFAIEAETLGVDLDLTGEVVNVMSNPQYAFDANIYNPAGNFGAPEVTLKTRINGDINGATAQLNLLNVVNNEVKGIVDVRWNKKPIKISADIQSPKINLQNFSSNSNFALRFPSVVSSAQALTFVSPTNVPYNLLYDADGDVKLDVKKLVIAPGIEAENIKTALQLNGGKLVIDPLTLDFSGGEIDAKATINAQSESIELAIVSKNMLLQNLYKEFAVVNSGDFGIKTGGNLDLDINIYTKGKTYRDLSQNLDGQVIAIVGKSEVQTGSLEFLKGGFINQLLSSLGIIAPQTKNMELTCAVVRADLKSGKAKFPRGIAVDSNQLTLVSDGNINLINDQISFTIEPSMNKLAQGNVAQAMASFIKVVGTLQDPKIRLDKSEALKTIAGVAMTGGVSYLGSQVLLNGSGEPCYVALEGTKYANLFPKPTGVKAASQEMYNDATKQIKKELKSLENTAKDFLKMFK
ncbi:MAG: AsmA family protein [Alphaproteobacteria bacterium]|nr:AsmA family protein [Alphaproteobacteria bacterium]